jgi:tetratricopeptide (TPR) repeat protein
MSDPLPIKYRAFLSYSHADAKWSTWLHQQLERFRIAKELAGRETPIGPVPSSLRPIFRDRDDFTGGTTLTEATIAALDLSAALIVICSTHAAGRPTINEEVRLFKLRHPTRPVIPIIVEGTPPDNFPSALRFEINDDGSISNRPVTVLAADLRDNGDGRSLGLAKVIAGLTGLSPDDIFRRYERTRRRAVRIRTGIIAVLTLLLITAGASAVLFRNELKRNQALLNRTLTTATDIVTTAVMQAEQYNVPRAATLQMLTRAEALFNDMSVLGRKTPAFDRQKALMLVEFAKNYGILGDTQRQRQRADEAYNLLASLTSSSPEDVTARIDLTIASSERAKVFITEGKFFQALAAYKSDLSTIQQIAQKDPTNRNWQSLLAKTHSDIAELRTAQGDLRGALEDLRAAEAIIEPAAIAAPEGLNLQKTEAQVFMMLGTAHGLLGEHEKALTYHHRSAAIADRLGVKEPNKGEWQQLIAATHLNLCVAFTLHDDRDGAIRECRTASEVSLNLASTDPTNTEWQSLLSRTQGAMCLIQLIIGDESSAIQYCHRSGETIRKLTKLDNTNMQWQQQLAVNYIQMGLFQFKNKPGAALMSLQAAMEINERLERIAVSDRVSGIKPNSKEWMLTMHSTYARIGAIQLSMFEAENAVSSFQTALEFSMKIRTREALEPELRRQIALDRKNLGTALAQTGKLELALAEFEAGKNVFADSKEAVTDLDTEIIKFLDTEIKPLTAAKRLGESGLLGRWRDTEGDEVEFKADGSATTVFGGKQVVFQWNLDEGGGLEMWSPGVSQIREVCKFAVAGDSVTLTECPLIMRSGGITNSTTLTRVK